MADRGASLYRPTPRFDLLRTPLLGRLLRWRWGRLVFQLLLLLVAALMLYDGFTGPQFAPENLSTVITWVHYRGVIVFGFLLLGNLFCMGCPFTIPRTLAKRLSIAGRRWPSFLRNKWLAAAILFLFFFLYEWLDLWASPLLTVWVIVGYFVASFVLEAFFKESPFCKYVCPLGTFNFVSSTISPLQITVADREVCRSCAGKECINGSTSQPGSPVTRGGQLLHVDDIQVLGCGTDLFAPQMQSNLDCTFCLDCARACPHDNVMLGWRSPLAETAAGAWPRRWDLAFLVLIFVFSGLGNAAGMVPPFFELQAALSSRLGVENEAMNLLLIFGIANLFLPISLGTAAAWLSRRLAGRVEPLRITLSHYVPAFAPFGFAIWLTHYGGFHFLSSALGIIPVFQAFLRDHGLTFLGQPNWRLGPLLPFAWLDAIELVFIAGGLLASLYVLSERARRRPDQPDGLLAQLPWAILLVGLALTAIWLFGLPMEMRGSSFMS